MMAKESVKKRMESESGISYTEFTYQLLQGWDFVHLTRAHGVRVQVRVYVCVCVFAVTIAISIGVTEKNIR